MEAAASGSGKTYSYADALKQVKKINYQHLKLYTMKKIFTLIIGLISISAVFAQSRYDRNDGYNGYNQSREVVTGRGYSNGNTYGYHSQQYAGYNNDGRRDEWGNRDYGRRNQNYEYGYSSYPYGRNSGYNVRNYERRGNVKSFAVGAIAGVLLGSILNNH